MKKLAVYLALLILAFILWMGYLLFIRGAEDPSLTGSATVETTEIKVGSKVGGRVNQVLVHEGDTVTVGQVLVRLDPYQLPAQREQLQAQLAQAEAILAKLQNGARPEEVASANAMAKEAYSAYQLVASGPRQESKNAATASRKAAESAFHLAEDNFKRMSALHERHVISTQEFDTARNQFDSAKERFNAAKEDEQAMLTGSRAEEIQAAQARYIQSQQQAQLVRHGTRAEDIAAQLAVVQGIRAQLTQMDEALDELTIKSPCNCVIASMDLKAGQLVMANQNLASLMDLNDLWVKIYIPEEDFGTVVVGDEAYAQVDAFPKITFHGVITQLASRAEFTPRNVQTKKSRKLQVFGVKVSLNNKDQLLRPGMILDVQLKPGSKTPKTPKAGG